MNDNEKATIITTAATMTPEAQRIAIAEICGWIEVHEKGFPLVEKEFRVDSMGQAWTSIELEMPDYLNGLNAMHEAEERLNQIQQRRFLYNLDMVLERVETPADCLWKNAWDATHATAAQRAEAFLRVFDKWTGE